jgi:hypothetical protein
MLKKAAEYCRKLENLILNVVCREMVREEIDPTHARR